MKGSEAKKTAYILARDGHTCHYCGGEFQHSELQKHHLRAKCKGGSNRTTNLITVCNPCHKKINSGAAVLHGRSTERLCPQELSAKDIRQALTSVEKLLLGDIRKTALSKRKGEMWADGEPFFIDAAAEAYSAIGETLRKALRELIPFSLVLDKADFDELYIRHNQWLYTDMMYRRYTWIIGPLDGIEAFRSPGNSNYSVSVMLLDGALLLRSFAYYPECEINEAAGVLFESSEDSLGLFCQEKEAAVEYPQFRPVVACAVASDSVA
jgi:hypothetical protein